MSYSIITYLFLIVSFIAPAPQTQTARFITVEGATLRARYDAALKMGRNASPQTRFWTAYSFDVRPGVAVDPEAGEFNGSMTNYGDTTVFFGRSGGTMVETRNLGIFMLHEADGSSVSRVEIYNLDRKREYAGYPVYWLGRGGNEESLSFLRGFVEANQANKVAGNATLAIALHDDPRVSEMLKTLARNSSTNMDARRTAVHWLGITGGETDFLASLVRDEREERDLRRVAGHALGISGDPAAINVLINLYNTIGDRELRRNLIHSISINSNQDPAIDFLIKVAKTDPDREAKSQALFWLGHKAGEKSLGVLKETVEKEDADTQVQEQAVFVISRRPADEAVPLLIKIARTHPKPEIRKQAMFWLGRTGDPRALAFFEEILGK